jgi:ribosomal protein S18 acetylase RimI-like enzyme
MGNIIIALSTEEERDWAATLIYKSDPWITLKVDFEHCYKTCHDDEYIMYTAHIDDAPGGIMILHSRGVAGSPYLKTIAVAEKYRSLGVGKALIEFAEDLYRKEAKHFFLCVSSFNNRAQSFYERLGYEKVGEFKDYIIEGESEILMHKKL